MPDMATFKGAFMNIKFAGNQFRFSNPQHTQPA
jgi:hypothetical protein